MHSLIFLAWISSSVHALGAGSDATQLWLDGLVLTPAVPIMYLLVLRVLIASIRFPSLFGWVSRVARAAR
jgi:hypothetical protein